MLRMRKDLERRDAYQELYEEQEQLSEEDR